MGKQLLKSVLLACWIAMLGTFMTSSAYGRAGGGGHFSGGGSHGGGGGFHSSGGGGFGHSSGYSYGSHGGSGTFNGWVFIVIVAVIVGYILIQYYWSQMQDQQVRQGRVAIDLQLAEKLADEIRVADSAFDTAQFYARVSSAFLKIQSAWSAQQLLPLQPFVSDGVFERFGLQIREQQALGYRDRMEQVRVSRVLLARFARGQVFEAVTLRIDASAVDFQASLATGQHLSGSTAAMPITEFWTFLRRRGAATTGRAGLIEGNCPNCGGDVSINQNAACAHCGALLKSGEFDWVLCEITQESEWRPSPATLLPGFEAMHEIDPAISTDELEDRASVIFWRRAEADRIDQPAVLRKVARDDFVDTRHANAIALQTSGSPRNWIGEIGVGAVDTLGLVPGQDFDRAMVQVAWSGTKFTQLPGKPVQRLTPTSVIRETFVLSRQHGVRSDPAKGISSAHCPSCGNPVSNSLSNACDACGTILNDGSNGWVLEAVDYSNGEVIRQLKQQLRAGLGEGVTASTPIEDLQPSGSGLLKWAINLSLADGVIEPREQTMIERFARKAGVDKAGIATMVAQARAGQLDAPEPQGVDQTQAWLTAMIQVALADGRLGNREFAWLKSVGTLCGLSEADIRLTAKREQARLIAAGREAQRGGIIL